MIKKVELLVHAGAPSTRNHDARYKAQAEAYLTFEGTRHNAQGSSDLELATLTSRHDIDIFPRETRDDRFPWNHPEVRDPGQLLDNHDVKDDGLLLENPEITDDGLPLNRCASDVGNRPIFLDDTQLAISALESQVITSSLAAEQDCPYILKLRANVGRAGGPLISDEIGRKLQHLSPTRASRGESRGSPQIAGSHGKSKGPPTAEGNGGKLNAPSTVEESGGRPEGLSPANGFQGNWEGRSPGEESNGRSKGSPTAEGLQVYQSPALKRKRDQSQLQSLPSDDENPSDSAEASLSSYLKSPVLDREGKKKRLDLFTDSGRTARRVRPPSHPAYQERDDRYMVDTSSSGGKHLRTGRDSQNRSIPKGGSSELPTSYSLSDVTSESSKARLRGSQRSTSDPGPIADLLPIPRVNLLVNDQEQPAPNSGAHDMPLADGALTSPIDALSSGAKSTALSRPRGGSLELQPGKTGSDDQTSELLQSKSVNAQVLDCVDAHRNSVVPSTLPTSEPTFGQSGDQFESLSTSIRPPPPSVGIAAFETHITESLRFLGENSSLSDSYRPVEVFRELRPLERGHWAFHPSSWEAQAQLDFWYFLEKMVGNGDAGWGVWCSRGDAGEDLSERSRNRQPTADFSAAAFPGLGKVRVFCWGEVVRHVYLMLYVASRNQVRKLGLQWIDGEGQIVLQMRDR